MVASSINLELGAGGGQARKSRNLLERNALYYLLHRTDRIGHGDLVYYFLLESSSFFLYGGRDSRAIFLRAYVTGTKTINGAL